MPYREEADPQEQPGAHHARLLANAAALKRFSRRGFLAGTGASALLAADMLV
ncbi:MAG: alpha/beta hydrolase, partial [Actinomycetota bacterium]|nr:alpha/beta hydrolase [Actinomycetota bacterium]